MASSKLKLEERTRLYWGKFKYKCDIYIQGAWLSRYVQLDGELVSTAFTIGRLTEQYSKMVKERVYPFTIWRRDVADAMILGHNKITIQTNKVTVFSNDLAFLKDAGHLGTKHQITEVKLLNFTQEQGVMYFKRKPKFQYRIYLDFTDVDSSKDEEFLGYLLSFMDTYVKSGSMEFSPNIMKHFTKTRSHGTYFMWGKHNHINYNDPGFSTILRLTYPQFVYRQYRLEQIPLKQDQNKNTI